MLFDINIKSFYLIKPNLFFLFLIYDHVDPSILAGSYNFQILEIEAFTETLQ